MTRSSKIMSSGAASPEEATYPDVAEPKPAALWWQRGVVYQIYPRSFKDTDGDGVGNLRGVTQRLDYLVWLGVDAIWLNPFYPSPMEDFGYDISDYCGVDPLFGTLEDFDMLMQEAHRRDLKIILDFVPNHTSDQHPWFIESRASRESPKRDWYLWRDPKRDGSPPNNWLSIWGGSAWTTDEATGQAYLHTYLSAMPDLNWRNPEVQAVMFGALTFWLERGVDGFRIDSAALIMKDPALRDNPPNMTGRPTFEKPMGDYDSQLHLYDQRHPDLHTVYRELRALLECYSAERPRVAVGEIAIFDLPEWASYYGLALDELHMPFNFALVSAPWAADVFARTVHDLEANTPEGAWPNWVLGNHDQPRVASRFGPTSVRLATLLLLTLRGTPTLYYGDELGLRDVPVPPDRVQDPWEKRQPGLGLGRDPERAPMPWDEGANAGFTAPGGTPWLPLPEDAGAQSVVAQMRDERSILSFTRRVLHLRRERSALHSGSYHPNPAPEGCFAFRRTYGAEQVLVVLNFADMECTFDLPYENAVVLMSTHPERALTAVSSSLTLSPHEGLVVRL